MGNLPTFHSEEQGHPLDFAYLKIMRSRHTIAHVSSLGSVRKHVTNVTWTAITTQVAVQTRQTTAAQVFPNPEPKNPQSVQSAVQTATKGCLLHLHAKYFKVE